MNGYLPSSPTILAALGAILAASLALGTALTRKRLPFARAAAWLALGASVAGAERLTRAEPGGLRMLAICAALLYGLKAVVGVVDLSSGGPVLPLMRWLGFTLTWPGMNPTIFARPRGLLPGAAELIRRGVGELFLGAGLLGLARWVWLDTESATLATVPLLIGLSLIGHFGLFGISAGLWRRRGVPCEAPFQAPLVAASLSEFWARRWNRPFSELIQRTIYRPVGAVAGRPAALLSGFALSGLLHELAITVPVRTGYGRPLAYFLLQGVLVLVENRLPPADSPWKARVRTLAAFALPVPLLLIPAFLRAAVWPVIGMHDAQ